jgi:hypothetical protein
MPLRKLDVHEFRKIRDALVLAEKKPDLIDEQRLKKLKGQVAAVALKGDSRLDAFWQEVHRDGKMLEDLARVLWHTSGWKPQSRNILKLMALQHGSSQKAAEAMRLGGYFDRTPGLLSEAVSALKSSLWENISEGGRKFVYEARFVKKGSVVSIPFEISLAVYSSRDGQSVTGAGLTVAPREFIDNIHLLKDVNLYVKYNGKPLRNYNKLFGQLSIPGSECTFKGRSFCAPLELEPLRSSCLSIAIYRKKVQPLTVQTLFIHPIGLKTKV